MQILVNIALVGFLVNDQTLRARRHQGPVFLRFHWADFERNTRHPGLRTDGPHASFEITVGNEFRMLARHEQDVPETFRREVPRLRDDLRDRQRDPQDRVVARETAIFAVVNALVGQIQRREQSHRAPEMLPRQCLRTRRHPFQRIVRTRFEQNV